MTPSTEELQSLRIQIEDLQASLVAIRAGGVDALLVGDADHQELYTLTSADRPYRTIVEEMGEGAATTTETGTMLAVNRQLCRLAGATRAELIGQDFFTLVVEDDHPALRSLLATGLGETTRSEFRLSSKDHPPVPVLVSSTGLDIDGVSVRCLVLSDLTIQKKAQAALEEAARISERHITELERLNVQLSQSNAELTEFAYVTSHDLSEPLRTVAAFADLLSRRHGGRLDAEAQEFIEFICGGVTRMQQLIDDLLVYSRIDTRSLPLLPVDTQLVLADVVADLHQRISEVGAEVVVEPLPVVLADQSQLRQVFTNLIANSLLYVDPGVSPRIRVSAALKSMVWEFTVSDNGIGIEPRHREQVFGMFKRLHTREEYPGSGIGLAIVQKVVRRHGGQVWITDHGPGTEVVFTLPRNGANHE